VALVALVALVGAMAFSTKWLTPEEAAALNPPPFVAADFVEEEFPKITETLTANATDITVLAPAVEEDLAAAGEEYGQNLGSGAYAFPVTATGTASEVDANFVLLKVPGLAPKYEVRVPLGAAVSGTPVRDATGDIRFGDFVDQTAFQSVANEMKVKIQEDVLSSVDPAGLKGKELTVVGAWATGGPPNSFIIQPVTIEVAP
jgi:predicted lipoprotein